MMKYRVGHITFNDPCQFWSDYGAKFGGNPDIYAISDSWLQQRQLLKNELAVNKKKVIRS